MREFKNILYLGWLGKHNVGDDVLYEQFKHMIYDLHYKQNKRMIINIDTFAATSEYKIDVLNYDLIVLGGGSLLQMPSFLEVCKEGIVKGVPVVSWGTGVDGPFSQDQADSLYVSGENAADVRSIYNQFDYISVRGPYSKNFLINSGITKEIYEIGDPALAYARELFGETLECNPEERNILINWGTSYNNILGGNEIAVENELVIVIQELLDRGYSVTVYPIWTEDIQPVKRLVQKVNNPKCSIIAEVYEARVLQKFISEAYLTINLKLHANILSASVDRPFISLAYRGKCFDFAKTVNCPDFAVPTDNISAEGILHLVSEIEMNYLDTVSRIKKARTKYYPKLVQSIVDIYSILLNQEVDKKEELIPADKQTNQLANNQSLEMNTSKIPSLLTSGYKDALKFLQIKGYKDIHADLFYKFSKGKVSIQALEFYLDKIGVSAFDKTEIFLKMEVSKKGKETNKLLDVEKNIPKVSIIITTYNRKHFVKDAVEGILNQDYKNIDLIIIDDNSTDGTESLLKEFSRNVTYIRNEKNIGPSESRRKAFDLYADGEYVLFLDDDDYLIDMNYISKAISFHKAHPDLSFVSANVFYEYTQVNKLKPLFLNLEEVMEKKNYFLQFENPDYPKPASTLTTLFKRSTLKEIGLSSMKMVNDASIYLKSLLVGNAGFIEDIVGVYRIHQDNITFNLTSDFIIGNLEEKKAIKDLAIISFNYEEKSMDKWMDNIAYRTIQYYLSNTFTDLADIKKVYWWAKNNCPEVILNLSLTDSKVDLVQGFSDKSELMGQASELCITILEGIKYADLQLDAEKFDQSIMMMNNVFEAFASIKRLFESLPNELMDADIEKKINGIENILEQIVSAYEMYELSKVKGINSSLIMQFESLIEEMSFYSIFAEKTLVH
ncbi:glycosyltransferase [Rossellomorea marisflavi]|uniref:glycosyltransferase n=1 Tax=Rossellomorea marisflavi TaxID=189381 RepID=UPI0039BF9304